MRFNVSQLLKESTGSTRIYKVNEVGVFDDGDAPASVEGRVAMLRTNRGILVTGYLTTVSKESCSRCLEAFPSPTALEVQEEFFPTADVNTGASVPLPEDAGPFIIDRRHIIDLSEAVRQAVILARPMGPLCKVDCLGLCQSCGHNLNIGPCDCTLEGADHRWAPLETALKSWAAGDR